MDSRDCGASEQKEGKYRRKKERKKGVTFTARKRPSKLMFTMTDFGHTLPGRQN